MADRGASERPEDNDPARQRWWERRNFALGIPLLVGLVHVALIAPKYFVGSFDDDSSYILAARGLLHGDGLTGHLASGAPIASVYPPGYPALLVPFVWIWPHSFVPLRVLSGVCFLAVFPLTWTYLRRKQVPAGIIGAALLLMALCPVFATFGSMVMAEAPFLLVFVLFLLALDRWDSQEKVLTLSGVATAVSLGCLIWLKEAAIGLVAGVVVWQLVSRRRPGLVPRVGRAALASVVPFAMLIPVVVARISAGVPVVGSRYSIELGGYYQGGLLSRIIHVAPHGLWSLWASAVPSTLVPYLTPLPIGGHLPDFWKALSWHVPIFVLIGAVAWFRRHRDALAVVVPVYLLETIFWPYVNERRVILVLPVVAVWYVLGALTAWRFVREQVRARRPDAVVASRRAAATLAVAAVAVPLVVQAPRDYLFHYGQPGSQFQGSRFMSVLASIGPSSDVFETDYLYSTALFSGHPTARSAFDVTLLACYLPGIDGAIQEDRAGFLLLGDVNKPGIMDSPCLLQEASQQPWAVRLLSTARDDASVFELIGPGTAHPDLADLTRSAAYTESSSPGSEVFTWSFGVDRSLSQVSLGEAAFAGSRTTSVTVQLLTATGWVTVASTQSAVGDGAGRSPFLLAGPSALAAAPRASAARVVVSGTGGSAGTISDFHVLGQAGP